MKKGDPYFPLLPFLPSGQFSVDSVAKKVNQLGKHFFFNPRLSRRDVDVIHHRHQLLAVINITKKLHEIDDDKNKAVIVS